MSYEDPFSADSQALIGFAKSLAKWLHRGQKDKSGEDYFQHPWRVFNTLAIDDAAPVEWQVAALLHDVVEDTRASLFTLRELEIPDGSLEIIRLVSRNLSEPEYRYEYNRGSFNSGRIQNASDYYYDRIRQHPGALAVKLADIRDNLLDWRLESLDEKTQTRLRKKYARALELLKE